MKHMARVVMLHMIDSKWKEHLYAMDNLREGIGLRAYGQRDPLVEYQHEGYIMFTEMADRIKEETVEILMKIKPAEEREVKGVFESVPQEITHPEFTSMSDRAKEKKTGLDKAISRTEENQVISGSPQISGKPKPYKREGRKVGRNEPCPCGSGKKFKKCCGK
jgi:preprotein translocase subunit SecA